MGKEKIDIKNRKARFNYEVLETYEAGIKLVGSEIKSIRQGRASLREANAYSGIRSRKYPEPRAPARKIIANA